MVGVAVLLTLDTTQRCTHAAVALTGVGGVPYQVTAAADILVGHVPDEARIAAIAQAASTGVEPDSDIHASAAFRRHLSGVLTRRALHKAVERARGAALV
jgi:carbon-monoxide dehydrogenase medium subunit